MQLNNDDLIRMNAIYELDQQRLDASIKYTKEVQSIQHWCDTDWGYDECDNIYKALMRKFEPKPENAIYDAALQASNSSPQRPD